MQIDRDLAARLAAVVEAQPKECYRNAVLALYAYRGEEAVVYVEGLLEILEGLIQVEHGWLEVGGRIVDVTVRDCAAACYTPVFRYEREEVEQAKAKRSVLYLPLFAQTAAGHRAMGEASLRFYREKAKVGENHEEPMEGLQSPRQ